MRQKIKALRAHPAVDVVEDALALGAVCVLIVAWFALS